MRIVITGYPSQPGTETYHMALGLCRAEATKAYLVSQGVGASGPQIATRGENELVIDGPCERAETGNRARLHMVRPEITLRCRRYHSRAAELVAHRPLRLALQRLQGFRLHDVGSDPCSAPSAPMTPSARLDACGYPTP